jgi:hypothetical protein
VDHERTITVTEGNSLPSTETDNNLAAAPIYESEKFDYNTAIISSSNFNNTGTYTYFEKDVNEDDPSFVMNGTITVINQPESLTSSVLGPVDTVGVLMVPFQDLQTYTSDLHNRGFTIDSTHNFKDLRGGQSGTGDEQAVIVWTTYDMSLPEVITNLQEFALKLPYS